MTEQVVDIRDRIEKMRNQMTGGSSSAETEPQLEKKISQSSVDPVNADYSNANSNKFHEPVKNSFQKNKKSGETEINIPPKKVENEIRNEDSSQQNFKKKISN